MSDFERNDYSAYNIDKLSRLLFFVTDDGRKADELANRLVERCSNVDGIFATASDELSDALREREYLFIRLVAVITSRRLTEGFRFCVPHTRYEICEYLKASFLCETQEMVKVIPLNEKKEPLCCRIAAKGTVNASDITTRSIAEIAFSAGAKRVVIAHNHPRGFAAASSEDLSMTKTLAAALGKIGVCVEYHVVIAGQECDIIDNIGFSD